MKTFDEWRKDNNFVDYHTLHQRFYQDGYSFSFIEKKWQEIKDMYNQYRSYF